MIKNSNNLLIAFTRSYSTNSPILLPHILEVFLTLSKPTLLIRLAICDGYRVIALNPSWGKAYYRLAEAYKEDGCLQEAIFFNQRGLEMSEDDNETEELKKQHAKFGRSSVTAFGETNFSVLVCLISK